ncbi:phosphoribosylaminoimidazolesuccinocarboxamide synthase [bacterium]|jgi:phosphoribosylaminoimidazole-succinocarboxamide synthase|nr:phosphoribosylaminoimidazolesuccinocarboxamide synthase [bacterium]MBT4122225.1 phosphoribosylaminoimidazolesuccinocarboxamide synthase [bacterium]MBT4335430.1 phosphoribosylaminoimidazolesuccinocarboxamide synthase [bacterium]MBT4495757.1 phosphoribosylaminoimidazolesuccinocarboxamide synthase [bacterium]MBT4763955.1 phosphoribosylaminoimidazolesuccinocarboxamide synthase [bacterium]
MEKKIIQSNIKNVLTETNLVNLGTKQIGKVRDVYVSDDKIFLIATDRQSAFDRVLASIPFKGQVLTQTSKWWFEQTKSFCPNSVIDTPDPNVSVQKNLEVMPFEVVIRGYITGTTDTAAWTNYQKGVRDFCGNKLPENMVKNQKFDAPIITPTTKFEKHDRNISKNNILSEKMCSVEEWEYISEKAFQLFAFGQKTALAHGLILVDTKYEFGKDKQGNIFLIDEIHTPDSSRYWLKETYQERISEGNEPDNIDKEFLRLWFKDNCDPYHDEELPEAPRELIVELSMRYIKLFEMITGETFSVDDKLILSRIEKNLKTKGYM